MEAGTSAVHVKDLISRYVTTLMPYLNVLFGPNRIHPWKVYFILALIVVVLVFGSKYLKRINKS